MSDIFLSYANEDRERAGALAASLANHGWTVFWDRTIPAGKTWRQVIGAALDDARSVVVLWSRSSIQSDWVHEEADEGRERNVLIPVLIEDVRPPIGFRSMQAADLADWDGSDTFPAYRRLIGDIEGLLGPSPVEAKKRAEQESARNRAQDEARREAEKETARQEAEKEAQQKAEREQAVTKRKAEEDAEARRRAKEQAEIERRAEEEEAMAEHLTPDPPATPPSAKRSKLPWMMAGAAVVAVGIGLAVYQPWNTRPQDISPTETEQQATVQETEPEPAEVISEEPEIEALDAEMVALANANVREGPGMEYEKLDTLSRGRSVKVSGHAEDWYRIVLDGGGEGYVFKELLGESKSEAATDVAADAAKTLEPGETFRDCDVCPEMVVIPAGSFQMGSPMNEKERDDDEGPVPYSVRIAQPFAVGVNEVTSGEFVAFLNAVGRRGPANEPWFETKSEARPIATGSIPSTETSLSASVLPGPFSPGG